MFRRTRSAASGELGPAYRGFVATVRILDEAKASLAAAAPTGRPSAVAPAEALALFEAGLAEATQSMPAWRMERTEAVWLRCRGALDETMRRAEDFRMHGSPADYPELVEALDRLVEPLAAFEAASVWFQGTESEGQDG